VSPSSGATAPIASGPAITADPHQVAAGAWSAASQLPFDATFRWKGVQSDPQGSSPIGQPLTATVFYIPKDTTFQALTSCADPTDLLVRTIGAQHTEYTATAPGSTDTASQFLFFFADTASARQAFNWIQAQYSPACVSGGGMTSTKSAGDGQSSAAWFSVSSTQGPGDLPSYTREYFVLRGDIIGYVLISSSTGNLPTTPDGDTAQLSTLAAHLCVYGGPCT
jgi:hypothetical protein